MYNCLYCGEQWKENSCHCMNPECNYYLSNCLHQDTINKVTHFNT